MWLGRRIVVDMASVARTLFSWLRWVIAACLTVSTAAGFLGFPSDVRTYYTCLRSLRWHGGSCDSIRAAVPADLSPLVSGWDFWHVVNFAGMLTGLALLFGEPLYDRIRRRPRAVDQELVESLRRAEERDRRSRVLAELDRLRNQGAELRERIRRMPAPPLRTTGSIAPATVPFENADDHDVSQWREDVASFLWVDKPLAQHFTGCLPSSPPLERMNCHIERLDRVLDELRRQFKAL